MPISTFYGLQTSLRGLLAQQRSIDVTGHNIANASTVGYSRQEAVLAPSDPYVLPAGSISGGGLSQMGTGVEVDSYRRVRDTFLDLQFRAQNMRLGQQETMAEGLDRAELSLAEPGQNGLSTQLARFWSAWADLANSPDDLAARAALVQQATAVGEAFKTVDSQLTLVRQQAGEEYAALVGAGGEIENYAREIASLNDTIRRMTNAGDPPADLQDRRDLLLDKLSFLGQVSVTDMPDGTVTVNFGDALVPLVQNATVTWPQALTSPGGRLGALNELSRPGGSIDTYRNSLDGVAKQLADSVNAVHGAPPFFSYTPGTEAGSLAVAVTRTQVRAGASGAAGANDIALQISGLRNGAADEAYRAFVGTVGTDVREAKRQQANASALVDAVDNRRQSVAGVALDEEMTNLVRFQRAYQASSRAMSTMDEMLDVLVNRTGRVGL